ncbi:hypothetical protein [Mucilaginibacter aquariorum]|uniref:SDR family NAD(P)-dependent oxidoreductase n=1 Tax=Mucilaginibacter aquariorum TaxID=2967225 RepID=A0ABT1T9U1_9SPHI|nr:hypothetical protein [Mucilaginibacter aquariorum]MCQ6961145.1 hypothetical protein [Mucilaginibacter aquariorum]
MENKTIRRLALVTGANQGVGLEVVKKLVAAGHTILLGSRDLAGKNILIDPSSPILSALLTTWLQYIERGQSKIGRQGSIYCGLSSQYNVEYPQNPFLCILSIKSM